MKHFPIFLNVETATIIVSGGGEAALAKLRLLLKTEAAIIVFSPSPAPEILRWEAEKRLTLEQRNLQTGDTKGAALFYAADEDAVEDARTSSIARSEGALVNVVDNLEDSQFITPAIVDRDPVTVAIGTEGAAPVLARAIKRDLEVKLPNELGRLARIGKAFRPMAERLPFGRARRAFWSDYYFNEAPRIAQRPEAEITAKLNDLLEAHLTQDTQPGHVDFVGAGPGDADLLTLRARLALDKADVVIHDSQVPAAILELARREAVLMDAGHITGTNQGSCKGIGTVLAEHAGSGRHVVRLTFGDPTLFGRFKAEIAAVETAGLAVQIIPGVTVIEQAARPSQIPPAPMEIAQ